MPMEYPSSPSPSPHTLFLRFLSLHAHGDLGDATLVTRDREYLQAVQTRVGDLKRQGKTIDEAVQAVAAEIAPKYPEWGNPSGSAATARAAFAEAK